MLNKDFRNLPYGSLCVLSIVKRAVIHLQMIATDFEGCLQLMVVVQTRCGMSELVPMRDRSSRLFSPEPCCASMCARCHGDAWGDGRAIVGRRGRRGLGPNAAGRAGQGTRHGETIPIPDFESHLHLASFVSRADSLQCFYAQGRRDASFLERHCQNNCKVPTVDEECRTLMRH